MKKLLCFLCIFIFGMFAYGQKDTPTRAASCDATSSSTTLINPVKAIETNWKCLEDTITQNNASMEKNPKELFKTVKQVVLPMISLNHMAGLTLGPKWRSATKTEREAFIDNFGYMLVRSYAAALLSVSNYSVTFNPLRDDSWKTEKDVQVSGRVTSKSNNKGSSITYYLERKDKTWVIYDVSIEGVSFVKNFRAQFREYPNMTKLIERLKAVNLQKGT